MTAPLRKTLHLARAADAPVEIERFKNESDKNFAKRCAAIRALGDRWQGHPRYVFVPLHSTHSNIWRPAHLAFWASVHVNAMKDREKNPAFQRAQAVRAAVGEL